MDFSLDRETEVLRERVEAFLEEAVIPQEPEAARDPERLEVIARELQAEAQRRGLFLPHMPRELGGLGLSWTQLAVILEEAGRSLLGPRALNAAAPDEGNMHLLHQVASPEQKRRYLEPLAAGEVRSGFAMTEPMGAGADPSLLQTTARRKGRGFVLEGRKWFITGAEGAAFFLVLARAEEGPTIFLVDRENPGLGKLLPQVEDLQARVAEEEAKRARLQTELDVARDVYNAVYRYAETLKQMASRPKDRLREVNPDVLRYRDQVVELQAEIAALEAEKAALNRNLAEYDRRIQERRAQVAAQERDKEAITLEYNTKKAAYEAFRARYDQIANLSGADLAFDNPNPEYQRLRSALIDAQAEEARLLARKAALEARIAQVEARINVLKDRVARAQVEQDTLSQALELAKNAYLALAQKRTDLGIQIASSQEAWASILAPAYPVYEKVAPRRGLLFALAVALGLMLGVMAAFVAEALRPQEAPSGGSA